MTMKACCAGAVEPSGGESQTQNDGRQSHARVRVRSVVVLLLLLLQQLL